MFTGIVRAGKVELNFVSLKAAWLVSISCHKLDDLPLKANDMKQFRALVESRCGEIVQKWVDDFVLHKSVYAEKISKPLP